jgi:hypothetical protein
MIWRKAGSFHTYRLIAVPRLVTLYMCNRDQFQNQEQEQEQDQDQDLTEAVVSDWCNYS